MVLAEKIVTAMERGTANTRWRDFVDITRLSELVPIDSSELRRAIEMVANHRAVQIRPLAETLDGYPQIAQTKWAAWRRKQQLTQTTPEQFAHLIAIVCLLSDPLLQPDEGDP